MMDPYGVTHIGILPYIEQENLWQENREQHFNGNQSKYHRCFLHIRHGVYVSISIQLLINTITFISGLTMLAVKDGHYGLETFALSKYYANRENTLANVYFFIAIAFVVTGVVHTMTLLLCLLGHQSVHPLLLLPELTISILKLGFLIFLSICFPSISLLMWSLFNIGLIVCVVVVNIFMLIIITYHLYILVWAYRYCTDKRRASRRLEATSRSVRFRSRDEGKKKKKSKKRKT